MNIKTIVSHPMGTGFYISSHRWNDPVYALTHRTNDAWRYIGGKGWYVTEENKAIYEEIDGAINLDNWYPGEFMEVDLIVATRGPAGRPEQENE